MNLDDLERIGKEATASPWQLEQYKSSLLNSKAGLVSCRRFIVGFGNWPDAHFIATARNYWDRLIAVAKAAEVLHRIIIPVYSHSRMEVPDSTEFYNKIRAAMQDAEEALAALKDEK